MKPQEFFVYKDGSEKVFMGQNPNERVIEVSRRGFVVELVWVIPVAVLLAIFVSGDVILKNLFLIPFSDEFFYLFKSFCIVNCLLFGFNRFADWFYSVNVITNQRVIDFEFSGLGLKKIVETELRNIQSVSLVNEGVWSFIFGLATIHVLTSGDNPNIDFEHIGNSKKIQDLLSDLARNPKGAHGR